jgi:hypothetical protein
MAVRNNSFLIAISINEIIEWGNSEDGYTKYCFIWKGQTSTCKLLINEKNDERSVATDDDSSNAVKSTNKKEAVSKRRSFFV